MIYEQRLTIPKLTPADAPVSTVLEIHPGVITSVSVYFPPGVAALAHVQVWHWERQLWPANPNSDFTGDDLLIQFGEDLAVVDPPYELVFLGWNDDDTYSHTPILRVQITPFAATPQSQAQQLFIGSARPLTRVGG